MSLRRRAPWLFAIVALGTAAGCASILGLDEVTESNGPADEAGTTPDGTIPEDGSVPTDGSRPDTSTTDGGTDAPNDARRDGDADATVVDAGCTGTIATDFANVVLPAQITQVTDGIATIAFDNMGVGGTRAAHMTAPVGAKSAELVINISSLQTDGAKQCAVTCSVDVQLLQRGGNAEVKLLVMESTLSAATFAALIHSNTFTYFARSGMGLEAPDLGTTGNAVFSTLSIDVSGNAAPFSGKGAVGATSSTKQLTFDPQSARVGIVKLDTDPLVEAIFDNLSCKAHN